MFTFWSSWGAIPGLIVVFLKLNPHFFDLIHTKSLKTAQYRSTKFDVTGWRELVAQGAKVG